MADTTPGLTVPRANAWLNLVLSNDGTLLALGAPPLSDGIRIYRRKEPQKGALYPVVIYQYMSPSGDGHVTALGNITIYQGLNFIVKAVGPRMASQLEPIMNRVDTLLNGKTQTIAAGAGGGTTATIIECIGQSEIEYQEESRGIYYDHLGREYTIRARLD